MQGPCGGIRWRTPQVPGPCGGVRWGPLRQRALSGVSCRISRVPLPQTPTQPVTGGPPKRGPRGSCCLILPCLVRVSCTRYFLQPRDNGSKSLKPEDLGSLRLNVVYTEDHVFSSDYYSPLRDLLLRSADVEVPAWPAHRGPPLGLPCVRDRLGLPLLGMGALTHPQREPQDPAPPTPGALTVTPGLWPSVHRPRCCVWVGGGGADPPGARGAGGWAWGSPPSRPVSPARLGVRGPHPGRGLQGEAGGGCPAGAALPALRPGGALHQCHRQRRGPEDPVSAERAPRPSGGPAW